VTAPLILLFSLLRSYNPRLWSFVANDGNGVELYFMGRSLVLSSGPLSSRKSCTLTDFTFEEGRWYFLALTFSNHTKLSLSNDELKLYVDGVVKQKATAKYPSFPGVRLITSSPLRLCRV
jgi:hypothetical protein